MKQTSPDKYNVAWFKLAEFVSRGEKERALALYRLLAHALDDQAFARQLEGDILLAFNDETAYDRYGNAARLYIQQGRSSEAAAVYEHMVTLEPTTNEHLLHLVDLHKQFINNRRITEITQHLLRCMVDKREFERASWLLQQLDDHTGAFAQVHQELVQAWIKMENPPTDSVMVHVKKIIDHYFSAKQQKPLQTFLMTLKMVHDLLYQKACGYMQDGNLKW